MTENNDQTPDSPSVTADENKTELNMERPGLKESIDFSQQSQLAAEHIEGTESSHNAGSTLDAVSAYADARGESNLTEEHNNQNEYLATQGEGHAYTDKIGTFTQEKDEMYAAVERARSTGEAQTVQLGAQTEQVNSQSSDQQSSDSADHEANAALERSRDNSNAKGNSHDVGKGLGRK